MADLQITQLPALASASIAGTDPLALADVSASETKKVTVKDLIERGVDVIDAGSIPATALSYPLSANAIVTATILDANVTNAKLANSSVSFGGVSVALGASDATPAFDLTDATGLPATSITGSISNGQLAGSITGDKLIAGTIGTTQLADNSVNGSKLTDNIDIAGTLDVTGVSTFDAATTVGANFTVKTDNGEVKIQTAAGVDKFVVDTDTGNTTISGSLTVTGDVVVSNGSIGTNELSDSAVTEVKIAANAITNAKIASSAVSTLSIAADSVTTSKIVNDAVTNDKIADSAVTAASLGDNSVTTNKIVDAAVTNAKLATNAVSTLSIAADSVTTAKIADGQVTAAKLSNDAINAAAIANLAVTNAKIANTTITADKLDTNTLNRGLNVDSSNLGIANAVTGGAATRSGITYDAQGLITSTAALIASDLPAATTSAVGAVSVPTAGGLGVTNLGVLSIANSVTAGTTSGITFDANGLITGTAAIVGGDLPVATATVIGAIKVPVTSSPLSIDGSGVLTITNSSVSAGTYESVTVNAQGIVTAGTALSASDIPVLDASKITTGSFATARIADNAITMDQIGNNAVSFIQEAQPAISNLPTGVQWLQESTGQLRIFNGNSWFSVGFGRLAEENLRFCGTFDADDGLVVTLTTFGTSAGFSVGNAIPAATNSLTGCYFVCIDPGNGTSVVPNTSFDAGDWAMCVGSAWNRVDTLSGPGSVSSLDDLSDVSISSAAAGEHLVFHSDGQWKNVATIDGGTY